MTLPKQSDEPGKKLTGMDRDCQDEIFEISKFRLMSIGFYPVRPV
jgi:hypothetical protein